MKTYFKKIIQNQHKLCASFEQLLPKSVRQDGNSYFAQQLVPSYLTKSLPPGSRIYDVGGGKNPTVGITQKKDLEVLVTGIDIDASELQQAPEGAYDETVAMSITEYQGRQDGALVICRTVLEHVQNNTEAFRSLANLLAPGGRILLFVPSRFAVFACLNRMLPQALKCRLLYAIYPETSRDQGFQAHYDRCSCSEFRKLAESNGLEVEEVIPFYSSMYFTFFFPLHFVWRMWILFFRALAGENGAETFCMVLHKPKYAQKHSYSELLEPNLATKATTPL